MARSFASCFCHEKLSREFEQLSREFEYLSREFEPGMPRFEMIPPIHGPSHWHPLSVLFSLPLLPVGRTFCPGSDAKRIGAVCHTGHAMLLSGCGASCIWLLQDRQAHETMEDRGRVWRQTRVEVRDRGGGDDGSTWRSMPASKGRDALIAQHMLPAGPNAGPKRWIGLCLRVSWRFARGRQFAAL